jgi:hypothetical protein
MFAIRHSLRRQPGCGAADIAACPRDTKIGPASSLGQIFYQSIKIPLNPIGNAGSFPELTV